MKKTILPAILAQSPQDYAQKIKLASTITDTIHIDVMDGTFVPNTTISIPTIKQYPAKLKKEAHFMVKNPLDFVLPAAQAGITTFAFHIECFRQPVHIKHLLEELKHHHLTPMITLNPRTNIKRILPFLHDVKRVLIMSVQPGFGRQSFRTSALKKISYLHKKNPSLHIAVDGGLHEDTLPLAVKAGANQFVMGSALFEAKNIRTAMNTYKKILQQ